MYVVVHGDAARGAAIVQALGGEGQATLVKRAGGAIRLAMDGVKLDGLLVSPDVVDTTFYPGDFRDEQALRGVPVLFEGGSRGPLYRAFALSRASGRAFRHLRNATPEQVAEALRALRPTPEPPPPFRRVGPWAQLLASTTAIAGLVANWIRPGPVLSGGSTMLLALLMAGMAWSQFGSSIVAAVRRGIRPTWGAILGLLPFVAAATLFGAEGVRTLRGG
jgi:hypothetical protein